MKVSVAMMTYNHERYIAQAINSVLMQNVSFDYELVIGEDCSTDNTRNIVVEFRDRYPDKIRLVLSDTRVGGHKNAARIREACQGQYIAVLDGDDYWTCPDKLQKQVDFMDSHPEYAACFHDAIAIYEDGSSEPHNYCPANLKERITVEDLLVADYIPSCGLVCRRELVGKFPDWVDTLKMGDWPAAIFLAQHGQIEYINEVMATYRIHAGGVWSRLSAVERLQANLEFYTRINVYLNSQYEITLGIEVSNRWEELAMSCVEQAAKQGSVRSAVDNLLDLFNHWSQESSLPSAWRVNALRRIWPILFFGSYRIRDFSGVRYCWPRMVWSNPAWFRNRGVWSIGAEAFLGQQMARLLRRMG
jgi:glycosyltransferase involved in cell wall biosynthesis